MIAWASASRAYRTERGGFEPPLGVTLKQISSLPHSTTLPPLQVGFVGFVYRLFYRGDAGFSPVGSVVSKPRSRVHCTAPSLGVQ